MCCVLRVCWFLVGIGVVAVGRCVPVCGAWLLWLFVAVVGGVIVGVLLSVLCLCCVLVVVSRVCAWLCL